MCTCKFQHFLLSLKSISVKFRSCNMHICYFFFFFFFLIKPSHSRKNKICSKVARFTGCSKKILTFVSMERDRGGQQKRNLTLVFTSPTCFPKISRKATFESAIFKTGNGESENRRMGMGMGNANGDCACGMGNGERGIFKSGNL